MSTNKHATIRYQALDRCFRNPGRKYFIEDLIDACNNALSGLYFKGDGIKRRQIFDDINFMESEGGYSAPIERYKDGKRVYYRYSDLKFSINSQPLNESEAHQLKETLLLLSRFKGMPQFEWIDEMIARLETTFSLKKEQGKFIEFEQNPYLKGLEYFTVFFDAIVNRRSLDIDYGSYKKAEFQKFIIHPYYLKQYNNRWFLFGLNDERNEITNIALDRVIRLKESKVTYKENEIADFSEYFEDIVGVSMPPKAKAEKVVLKISKKQWPYIESKPLHGSQKIKTRGKEAIIIELEVVPNFEFEALLLSFGEDIEVLKPDSFRNKLRTRISAMYKSYKK